MKDYKFTLEPYNGLKTRYHCPSPNCGKGKTFSRYIDTTTGEHVHPNVGRCNRESKCGYHYTPKQYFQDHNLEFDTPLLISKKPKLSYTRKNKLSCIPIEIFKQSLQLEKSIVEVSKTNHFVKFLITLFGEHVANKLVSRYCLGSSKYWKGATVFWQIDIDSRIRTGKIMLYSSLSGKRVKKPFDHINWAHKQIGLHEFNLRQCFFGEHLLIDITKPVALVESEKTAVIASEYLNEFIWLAVGSLHNLSEEKCMVLKGRKVFLFPDLNGYEKWKNKAKEIPCLGDFKVSDLLERKATISEKKAGLDLADFLIPIDPNQFRFDQYFNSEK